MTSDDREYSSDVAFTQTVKAIQTRKGSRHGYASMEQRGSWETRITPDLAAFIERQISAFLGTANNDGQPYIQHRGGPPGFLKVLDDRTIGFATSPATASTSPRAISPTTQGHSLPDRYRTRQRVKLWVSAHRRGRCGADRAADARGYAARPEHAILFTVSAWDANCQQHIPPRPRLRRWPRCWPSATSASQP
jgi:predicted pyridoxine 5'-phosphate oxidase superfamily flavin-nucleotide-binding protein